MDAILHLPREFYAALMAVSAAAFLLLVKAFSMRDEREWPTPPTREDELRLARAHASWLKLTLNWNAEAQIFAQRCCSRPIIRQNRAATTATVPAVTKASV